MGIRAAGLLLLFPFLMMNSCGWKKRPALPLPNTSERTGLELELSQVAWKHARCYFGAERSSAGDVESQIANCKQQLLESLKEIQKAKALHDYFERYYPTAGDALVAIPVCCCCQKAAPNPLQFKYMNYSQQPGAGSEGSIARADRIFNWIVAWAAQRLVYKPDSRRYLLELAIESRDKDKAEVTIHYVDDSPFGSVTTQGSLTISRGLYRYVVKRAGYKPFDSAKSSPAQYLNLVDWDWKATGLKCVLVPVSSDLDALPCNLP